jgi:hypothetical protein
MRIGSGLGGALGGAATGAKIGSIFPGIGTALGAAGGGLLGGLGGYFTSRNDKMGRQDVQTPEQQQALSQILSQMGQMQGSGGNYSAANNYLSKLLNRDPETYDRFAAPYLQNFQQNILPMLSERFAGIGGGLGGGALSSSGFAQTLGGAGANLQAQLAGLFSNLQQSAASQSMNQYNNLAGIGLGTRAFQPTYQPGSTGIAGGLAEGFGQSLGQTGGNSLMDTIFDYLKNRESNQSTLDVSEL